MFLSSRVSYLPKVMYDHNSILIEIEKDYRIYGPKSFRFEAMWTEHESFEQVLNSS